MMLSTLEQQRLSAELAAINALLASAPANDFAGKIGLEYQREELAARLALVEQRVDRAARVILTFGGQPVLGSAGIEATFAATAIGTFQDIVTKTWGRETSGGLSQFGPVPDSSDARLHVTSLVHGSFGFLLEEMTVGGEPMFDSTVKQAADTVADLLGSFGDENEEQFATTIEAISSRVFSSVKQFFKCVHGEKATFRLIEGNKDKTFNEDAVERAWQRIEHSDVEESRPFMTGLLMGIIPFGRRFEFQPDNGTLIRGKISDTLGQTYLERISTEPFSAGKRWRAAFLKKTIQRFGRDPSEQYTLLSLDELPNL
jgi:hypothetical protein